MTFTSRKLTKLCFTILCSITVAFMMGYWFYKYEVEDRDIGVVDYAPLGDADTIKLPDVSLCIENPVHDRNLKAINSSIRSGDYVAYLGGDDPYYLGRYTYDKMYEEIDYSNATLGNLNHYFGSGVVWWQNGTDKIITSDNINYIETFNGFYLDGMTFLKCFTMRLNVEEQQRLQGVRVFLDKSEMNRDLGADFYIRLLLVVHYPSQFFLLKSIEMRSVRLHEASSTTLSLEKLEILKQRNSRHRKCSEDIDNYDKNIVDELLHKTGCCPPYIQSHPSYPKCKTEKDIREGRIDILARKRVQIPNACQRISEVRQRIKNQREHMTNEKISETWSLVIDYPEEVKIITQSKDVDVHSLIGNIGGYLGLFLGKVTILIE